MKFITLTPKNGRGQRLIGDAGSDRFSVFEEMQEVSWSPKPGPWYHVRSVNGDKTNVHFFVHADNDINFTVKEAT